jgi:hypothetical protein
MPALRWKLDSEICISRGDSRYLVEYVSWKKWIVVGADQERRHTHGAEEVNGARPSVVIVRVGKAVNWRCDDVVESIQGTGGLDRFARHEVRKAIELGQSLSAQRLQEMALIDARESSIDVSAGASEIERNGHGGCAANPIVDRSTELAQPLQQHIPAERDTDKEEGRIVIVREQSPRDRIDIAGFAGMIESTGAIGLAATATKQQQIGSPPPTNSL